MTFKDTCIYMLIKYPNIFRNILDCYNHLFFANGNGYEWKNGELIECDPYGEHEDINIYDFIDCDLIYRMNDTTPKENFKFDPLCQYTKIVNIPIDIKESWLNAIENFIKMVKTSEYIDLLGNKIEDMKFINMASEKIKEIKSLHKI